MAEVQPRTVGKYRIFGKIGTGGMGTVHLGRFFGPGGFRRIVAIKRLHPQFAEDDAFVGAFLDEARLASRIHHPNVVASLDVVAEDGEVFLVFEHVPGVALSTLLGNARKAKDEVPLRVATAIMVQVLQGLQAAHDAKGDDGEPLGLVHRDVTPQNVLVAPDGSARLLDFGIAKAAGRSQHTEEGVIKGKRGYMAPEHLVGSASQASDVYSAAVMLWEIVACERLFPDDTSIATRLSGAPIRAPSSAAARSTRDAETLAGLDAIVLRGLSAKVERRFSSANEMAAALEALGAASAREIGAWVERLAHVELAARARLVEQAEQATNALPPAATTMASATVTVPVVDESSTAPSPPSKRRLWIPAIAVAAGVVLLLIFGRGAGDQPVFATAGSDAATAPSAASSVEAPAAAPVEPSGEAPADVATATTSATTPATATEAHAAGRPRPSQAKPRAPACKPYVIDADGHKKFNEACLR